MDIRLGRRKHALVPWAAADALIALRAFRGIFLAAANVYVLSWTKKLPVRWVSW